MSLLIGILSSDFVLVFFGGLDLSIQPGEKRLTTFGWIVIIFLLQSLIFAFALIIKVLLNKFKEKLK